MRRGAVLTQIDVRTPSHLEIYSALHALLYRRTSTVGLSEASCLARDTDILSHGSDLAAKKGRILFGVRKWQVDEQLLCGWSVAAYTVLENVSSCSTPAFNRMVKAWSAPAEETTKVGHTRKTYVKHPQLCTR